MCVKEVWASYRASALSPPHWGSGSGWGSGRRRGRGARSEPRARTELPWLRTTAYARGPRREPARAMGWTGGWGTGKGRGGWSSGGGGWTGGKGGGDKGGGKSGKSGEGGDKSDEGGRCARSLRVSSFWRVQTPLRRRGR